MGQIHKDQKQPSESLTDFMTLPYDFIIIIITIITTLLLRAPPVAYRSSLARGQMEAVAAGLHHSHNNARSKPSLQPTPQLTATLDP